MRARKKLIKRLGLILVGLVAGLAAVEVALRVAGLPRFYDRPEELTPRFGILKDTAANVTPIWVNYPGAAIRFRYDGNPRGYFDENSELAHFTNKSGFRGGEFETAKPTNTLRIAFLGDSFTFGEGVRFEHTYPERLAALLRKKIGGAMRVESCNFGVGGYNAAQSLHALKEWGFLCRPDIVVLGFALNDAELSLYEVDPESGRPKRRPREDSIPEYLDDPRPPDSLLYKSAIARFLWQYGAGRERVNRIVGFYRKLYSAKQPGWQACRNCLRIMAETCEQRGIPFVVILFPAFMDLNDRYPFTGIHARVRNEVEATSAAFIDLLPEFKGHKASDLWVHPADQHPNEIAHDIAARALADGLMTSGMIQQILDKRAGSHTTEQQ